MISNRDYSQANELTFKACFLSLLYNDILFIMDSEPEIKRRYADLTMVIRPDQRHLKIFDVLIEFKFLRLKDLELKGETLNSTPAEKLYLLTQVKKALEQGKKQATAYGKNPGRKTQRSTPQKICSGEPRF